ncbi:HNH endonuclease signature motif containing protein [Salana multivorans]|uniref:HNH endonuclease signature motif containing protein n=1 Tax=Salana multivorans TaxID=120377 RepID=UPI000F4C3A2B|nr:HNH endonuclease signature motif containing protein [Salana multivorans]
MSSTSILEQPLDPSRGGGVRRTVAELAALRIVDDDGAAVGLVPLARGLAAADSWESWRGMSDADVVDAAAAFARLEAYAASGLRRAAAELETRSDLAERFVAASERQREAEQGRDVMVPARTRVFRTTETASDELMMRLGISRRAANRLIAEGKAFRGALAPVGDALSTGDLAVPKATRLFDVLVDEPLEVCLAVAEEIVPVAAGLTPAEVERRARRLLIEVDPAAAVERRERARRYRNVSQVQSLADGMARLTFTSTLVDVAAVHTVCDLAARAARAGGDPRTLDQLRADTLTDLAQAALARGSLAAVGPTAAGERAEAPMTEVPETEVPETDGPDVNAGRDVAAGRGVAASSDVGAAAAGRARSFAARPARTLLIRRSLVESVDGDDALPAGAADAWADVLYGLHGTGDEPAVSSTRRPGPNPTPRPPDAGPGAPRLHPPHRRVPPEPPAVPPPELRSVRRLGWHVPELVGYGPLDHATARALAADPPRWLRVVLLDSPSSRTGEAAPSEPGYHPSAALRRLVHRDHPTCVAPVCQVPADTCQDDHVLPYPRGGTDVTNLRPLCLRHHVLKTHRGHTYSVDHATGLLTWTTATGHRYRRTPSGDTLHLGRLAGPSDPRAASLPHLAWWAEPPPHPQGVPP